MKVRLLLPLLAALAAACHSAPSKFYELSAEAEAPRSGGAAPPPVAKTPVAPITAAPITVALGRVDLPAALDRPQLARRHGPNQLDYAEDERWAGPLDQMVRRVLAEDLASRLPAGIELVDSGSSQPATVTVSVDIARFDADEDGRVVLAARWQRWGAGGASGAPHDRSVVELGSGSGGDAIAATMSHALAALAADIATDLR
jgi:hypothetical protein